MGQVLEALHRLQAIETQLAEIRRERDALLRRVDYRKRRVQEAQENIRNVKTAVREHQMRIDALQLEVNSRTESTNKHRQALNRAKTNKEYAAILTAMNTEKADMSKLETEILRLMEHAQNLQDSIAGLEAECARLQEDAQQAQDDLRAFDERGKPQREELQARRDQCAEQIEPTTLSTFNRVADHHDGEAMVPVLKLHPKRDEYTCAGCNIKLTLEIVNALQSRDEIQVCKTCGRILFLEPFVKESSRV